jgi:hypothetical protein
MGRDIDRRGVLGVLAVGGTVMSLGGVPPPAAAEAATRPAGPRAEFVYEAVALLEKAVPHGTTPVGQRFRVPIIGGTFEGADLRGRILPGGFDWQLLRPDGYLELVADYFMETDDKVLIQVTNRGLIHVASPDGAPRYVMTTPKFEAPMGKYGWLNEFIFAGRVLPGQDKVPSVHLSIFKLV